jgi:hypothetical protein
MNDTYIDTHNLIFEIIHDINNRQQLNHTIKVEPVQPTKHSRTRHVTKNKKEHDTPSTMSTQTSNHTI